MSEVVEHRAGLFGLERSNRDFSDANFWGKNQFNSSFPASLCCYFSSKGLDANYLQFSKGSFGVTKISIDEIFGTNPLSKSVYFSFETAYSLYDQYAVGLNPRTDLVISTTGSEVKQTAALEVKLTAIPDSTTHSAIESEFGAELVVRPDTIFYLAAGLAHNNPSLLEKHFASNPVELIDWTDPAETLKKFSQIHGALTGFLNDEDLVQIPNIIQPIWKTVGKSPLLADNCLDVFAWSTAGFLYFLLEISPSQGALRISRQMRSIVWTYSMLLDIAIEGQTNFQDTIDKLSYNTKNDKAFAASGTMTRKFMMHENLTRPRITKDEIKSIILGGGQDLLSPERRFDAIIVNSPELFLQ